MPADVLINEVCGDAPPAKATNLISIYVLRLRRLLGDADSAGRHAEALDAYSQARSAISDELGVDPGTELRQFYAGLLAKDDMLARDTRGTARARHGCSTTSAWPSRSPATARALIACSRR